SFFSNNFITQDLWKLAVHFPCDKEGLPVKVFPDLCKIIVFKYFDTSKRGFWWRIAVPVDGYAIFLCIGETQVCFGCFFLCKIFAKLFIFRADILKEIFFLVFIKQRAHYRYTT